MTIKVAKRFFNQNYTNLSFSLLPFITINQLGRSIFHGNVNFIINRQNYKKLPNLYPLLKKTTLCKFLCKKLPNIIQMFANDYLLTNFVCWLLVLPVDHHVTLTWFNKSLLLNWGLLFSEALFQTAKSSI